MSRPRVPYGSLSRGRVVRAALAVIDEHGLEALTMRAVADSLDVGSMSLYRHVRDRVDLLDAVAEALAAEVEVPDPASGAWQERVRALLHSLRRVALAHPHAFPLLELRPLATDAALARQREALAVLDDAGLTPTRTAIAARALLSYTTGFVLAEISGRTDFPAEPPALEAFDAGLELLLAGIRES